MFNSIKIHLRLLLRVIIVVKFKKKKLKYIGNELILKNKYKIFVVFLRH